jgi:plasmid stabilization system protein ParE
MMEIEWHDRALIELQDAIEYYEDKRLGLGEKFQAEVRRSIDHIKKFPNAWPRVSQRSRRIRTHRFPYGLVYQLHSDRIAILAIMHLHRKPGYWQNREELN